MAYIDLSDASAKAGGSRQLGGYLAVPEGEGPFPAVLMIHEVFGMNDVMRRHADRLAAAGYLTLAVDLYSDGGARRCLVSTMRSMISGTGKAFTDLATARTWLSTSERSTGKTGVIGFCMGGGFALLVANDGFDAASVNYGQLPRHLEESLRESCPVVANYGGRDHTLPGAAAKLKSALNGLGIENDVKEFPISSHAFMNDADLAPKLLRPLNRIMGIKPDPEASPEAWQRIEDHFRKYLNQPSTAP